MNTSLPPFRARLAFGIDENAGSPIIVKATGHGRRLRFTGADIRELSSPHPRTVVAGCLLQKESFTRWLSAPMPAARKAATVFHTLLDIQLPFSVEDCEVTLLGMRSTPDHAGTRGLIAGARKTDITRRLETLASLGLHPHLLDQESIALWSYAALEFPPPEGASGARIVVYSGQDRVTLAIGEGHEFLAAYTMRQADPNEVNRLLKSVFPIQPGTTEWIWTGPGAEAADSLQACHAALSTRWPGTFKTSPDPRTFLARALAARAMNTRLYPCNLRTGYFLHPILAQHLERQPVRLAVACLAAGVLLCLVNLSWQWAAQYRLAQGQQCVKSLATRITGTSHGLPPRQETLAARRFSEAQGRDMEPFLAATEAVLPEALKGILAMARDESVAIEAMTLNLKSGVIHGVAPKITQGEALARRLNEGRWISTIERKESVPGDDRVAFVIGIGPAHGKE